jgi:hypothetical protein
MSYILTCLHKAIKILITITTKNDKCTKFLRTHITPILFFIYPQIRQDKKTLF